MSGERRRMRMFAGPNGSGKTTVKNGLAWPESWFGVYINPDDLEKAIRETGILKLDSFGFTTDTNEIREHLADSRLLQSRDLVSGISSVELKGSVLDLRKVEMNSYYASALADFIRHKALLAGLSFSFETVMSSRDKVDLLRVAQEAGYRTYLYFVATEDPSINIARVKNRVADGGHDVPEDKIVTRYGRSLGLLREAIRYANRAYLFDTSQENAWHFAETTDGQKIELKNQKMPNWFRPIWDQF